MPRFVVLEHDHPHLHWDLMLEQGDTLRTWRLAAIPAHGVQTTCEQLPNHRRAYLDYEGSVSGNRGTVRRIMSGQYTLGDNSPECLRVELRTDGLVLELSLAPPVGVGTATCQKLE